MNILLTNDDGIDAEGMNVLFDVLSEVHDVCIVAPAEERSACSNTITIRSSMHLEKLGDRRYALDGFTADCVNVGINSGFMPVPDLVISGINHGPNLADDVYFSGTVAGARTAFIFGVSGIAVSLDCLVSSTYFTDAARFIRGFIADISRHLGTRLYFYNINHPDLPPGDIAGVKYTKLGRRRYNDSYRVLGENGSGKEIQLMGTIESPELEGSDVTELRKGYISVTPLTLDCTNHEFLRIMR
ncbi:MAG: 5'/3'-nucleotidase SurE [Spirochaetes bacterium]|nr:5'/3'-nucleotidase SurE [Spirochaetota bacterium]